MTVPTRVALVEDHAILAEALRVSLDLKGFDAISIPVSQNGGGRRELLHSVLKARPRVVIVDLDLGPAGDGSLLVRPLVEAGLRVLMVTAATDIEQVARAIEDGALGVIRKDGPFSELVQGVLAAAHEHEVMSPRARLHLLDRARALREERMAALAPFGHLTARECEVLRELTGGRTVAQIARRSVVSEATVRSQVQAILTKLGVRSQLEAVVAAQHAGWH